MYYNILHHILYITTYIIYYNRYHHLDRDSWPVAVDTGTVGGEPIPGRRCRNRKL